MTFLREPKARLICIIAVLILAVISSFVINIVRGNYYDTFVSTEGKVTDIEFLNNYPEKYARVHYRMNKMSRATHRIYYSFTVDEKPYGRSETFYKKDYPSKYRVGDVIEVWYDPQYPNNSFTYKPSPGLDVFVPYFICAPILVFIANAGRNKKGRALFNE